MGRMVEPSEVHEDIVLVSPFTKYGSWGWFEDVIAASPGGWRWHVVSYGLPLESSSLALNVDYSGRLRGDYVKFGNLLNGHARLAWLNAVWYVPLFIPLIKTRHRSNARVLIGNGILASALCLLVAPKHQVIFVHQVYSGWIEGIQKRVFAGIVRRCSAIVVNSEGAANDIKEISPMDRERTSVIPMWPSTEFFRGELIIPNSPVPRIVYIGRCDPDKCAQAFRVSSALAKSGVVEFIIAGEGSLIHGMSEIPNVSVLGYVSSREVLSDLLKSADWVWAPADTTYLSRPAWEALASGARVIISDQPPAQEKVNLGIRIPRDIIPLEFGRVVSGDNDQEALELLSSSELRDRRIGDREMRREYAHTQAAKLGPNMVVDVVRGVLSKAES